MNIVSFGYGDIDISLVVGGKPLVWTGIAPSAQCWPKNIVVQSGGTCSFIWICVGNIYAEKLRGVEKLHRIIAVSPCKLRL